MVSHDQRQVLVIWSRLTSGTGRMRKAAIFIRRHQTLVLLPGCLPEQVRQPTRTGDADVVSEVDSGVALYAGGGV